MKLGPHRDDPGRAPPHYDEDTAGSFDDVAASHKAQVGPDQSRPRPEGDQPRGTLASGNGGLGVGEGQVGRELGLAVGGLGPLAPERDRAWRGTKDPLCQKERSERRVRRPAGDQLFVPTKMKRSISALESTTDGSGSNPRQRAKAHRRLAAHNNERARDHDGGSARATTARAKAPARSSTPRGTQADRSISVIQHIYLRI